MPFPLPFRGQIYNNITECQRNLPPLSKILTLTVPMLVGDEESVKRASAELLDDDKPEWAADGTIEFLAKEMMADTAVERKEGSNYQRCIALWLNGVRSLGEGKRDDAKRFVATWKNECIHCRIVPLHVQLLPREVLALYSG